MFCCLSLVFLKDSPLRSTLCSIMNDPVKNSIGYSFLPYYLMLAVNQEVIIIEAFLVCNYETKLLYSIWIIIKRNINPFWGSFLRRIIFPLLLYFKPQMWSESIWGGLILHPVGKKIKPKIWITSRFFITVIIRKIQLFHLLSELLLPLSKSNVDRIS